MRAPDPEPTVLETLRRRQDAAAAGHTGDEAAARRALADPDGPVRATALGALARMGRLLRADVEAALADPDPVVRRRACASAGGVGAKGVVARMRDGDAGVVEAAAWALGEAGAGGPEVVDALSQAARSHPDPLCREAAVAALGAIGDPAGLGAILDALSDRPAVRRRAVVALAPFDGPEVQGALRRASEDRDQQVRQLAEDISRA